MDVKLDSDIEITEEHITDNVRFTEKLPCSPRFVKTHLSFHLLRMQLRYGETESKIVHIVRNPKDNCIPFYHHYILLLGFRRNLEDFYRLMLTDSATYAPFFKQFLSYWNKKDDENVLFLKYYDLKNDLPSVLKKTAAFFGKNLTNDQISTLAVDRLNSGKRE